MLHSSHRLLHSYFNKYACIYKYIYKSGKVNHKSIFEFS